MWTDKNSTFNFILDGSECPMRCKKANDLVRESSIMKPIGKVIKNIIYQLEVKCPNINCEQVMTLEKYEEHEYFCYLPKCQNSLCNIACEKLVIVSLFLNLA
jgi:hypothetical protein